MKQLSTYIILIISCIMIFASCQKDFDGVMTVEIEKYQGNDGKVYIDNQNFACWHDGDKIWTNIDSYGHTINFIDGKAVITGLTVDGTTTTIDAGYPYKYNWRKRQDNTGTNTYLNCRIPHIQNYKEDAQGKQIIEAPMYGENNGNTLAFKNICSLMKVVIPKSFNGSNNQHTITVNQIELIPEGSASIWGNLKINIADGFISCNKPWTPSLYKGNISLEIPDEYGEINQPEGKAFYIFVPPVSSGLTSLEVVVHYTDGYDFYRYSKKTTIGRNVILKRNTIYLMDLRTTNGNIRFDDILEIDPEGIILISNPRQFSAIGASYGHFKQVKDIEIPNRLNYSISLGNGDIYDGDNYSIIINSSNGIFSTVGSNVTIKNLSVIANIINQGEYVGGIVDKIYQCSNVVIDNCKSSGIVDGGGIIGQIQSATNINIRNCVNDATVTYGGIISSIDRGTVIIENCINNKKLGAFNSELQVNGGGIIGDVCNREGNYKVIVNKCINNGDISKHSEDWTGLGSRHRGGIVGGVGLLSNSTLHIVNCANHGQGSQSYSGGIIGRIWDGTPNIINSYSCANNSIPFIGDIKEDTDQPHTSSVSLTNVYLGWTSSNSGAYFIGSNYSSHPVNIVSGVYIGGSCYDNIGGIKKYSRYNWNVNDGSGRLDMVLSNNRITLPDNIQKENWQMYNNKVVLDFEVPPVISTLNR